MNQGEAVQVKRPRAGGVKQRVYLWAKMVNLSLNRVPYLPAINNFFFCCVLATTYRRD